MEPPPPTADETKSAKKKRYDRQLRLWGEHGQEAMESSNICLINGSASGSETLKNLVLPGACAAHVAVPLQWRTRPRHRRARSPARPISRSPLAPPTPRPRR